MSESPPPASLALHAAGVDHTYVATPRARSLEEHAANQGVEPDDLLKTLVVRRGDDDYVLVLIPGLRQLDWKKLRAHLGEHRLSLPDAEEAFVATGYERGTITPIGTARAWPVVADASIGDKGRVALGSGRHGTSIHVEATVLVEHVGADLADVTRTV